MKIDVDFVNNQIPTADEQLSLLKDELESINRYSGKNHKFNFVDTKGDDKLLDLGIIQSINENFSNEFDKERFVEYRIFSIMNKLALRIIEKCNELNREVVNIMTPNRSYLYTFCSGDNAFLSGMLYIYFDKETK